MRLFCIFGILSVFIVVISFFIALLIFSTASHPPTNIEQASFIIFRNHARAAFVAGVAIIFSYGVLRKLFEKNDTHRTALFTSFATALISCVGYTVSFVQIIFLPTIIIIMIVTFKLMESLRVFIEKNKLPKFVLTIPLLESFVIFTAMITLYINSMLKILKN